MKVYSSKFKAQVALYAVKYGDRNANTKYGISTCTIWRWKKMLKNNAPLLFSESTTVPDSDVQTRSPSEHGTYENGSVTVDFRNELCDDGDSPPDLAPQNAPVTESVVGKLWDPDVPNSYSSFWQEWWALVKPPVRK